MASSEGHHARKYGVPVQKGYGDHSRKLGPEGGPVGRQGVDGLSVSTIRARSSQLKEHTPSLIYFYWHIVVFSRKCSAVGVAEPLGTGARRLRMAGSITTTTRAWTERLEALRLHYDSTIVEHTDESDGVCSVKAGRLELYPEEIPTSTVPGC